MPRSVIDHLGADRICKAADLGAAVAEAVRAVRGGPVEPSLDPTAEDLAALETAMANLEDVNVAALSVPPAGLACPECHGALFEVPGEPRPRYRCWVGHAWSPQSLLEEQAAAFENALWMALRSLEEKASLARRMAAAAERRGSGSAAEQCGRVGDEAEQAARQIRHLIARLDPLTEPAPEAEEAG
jgi:two-component system chemotaxis response regulator CheB